MLSCAVQWHALSSNPFRHMVLYGFRNVCPCLVSPAPCPQSRSKQPSPRRRSTPSATGPNWSHLELAKELNNVSKACKLIGYSRQQFYEIRRNYQTYGAEGLLDKLPGCKGAHPNRVAPEIEQAILDYSLTRPTHGPLRVEQELALQGINVSAGGVRGNVTICSPNTTACYASRKTTGNRSLSSTTSKFACSSASAPSSANTKLRSTTPENWWRSTPSSSARSRAWARCICKPCWTATVATLGDASIPASCQ